MVYHIAKSNEDAINVHQQRSSLNDTRSKKYTKGISIKTIRSTKKEWYVSTIKLNDCSMF